MHVIFFTEFVLLIKTPPFYEVKSFTRKWRDFKNIYSRPLFTIIFRPEMLKFQPYSILTRKTMIRFVMYVLCVKHKSLLKKNLGQFQTNFSKIGLRFDTISLIVAKCTELTELNLDGSYLDQESISFLCRNLSSKLQKLSLYTLKVTDQDLENLVCKCNKIMELNLYRSSITG